MIQRIEYRPNRVTDLSKKGKAIGLLLPLNDSNGLFRQSYVTEDQVMTNLKMLLLTRKGERYGHPDLGTNIHNLLFQPVTSEDEFIDELRADIVSAIEYWMPYVTVRQLEVDIHPDLESPQAEYAVKITLRVGITRTNINKEVVLYISNVGAIQIVSG